jgi:ABC-type glycerol-3-phosphate transport system substrate-binding protein
MSINVESSSRSARSAPAPRSAPGTRRVSRRDVLRGGAVGGLTLGIPALAGACGGGGSGDGKATVRMWTWYGEQREQWPALIKEFESSHPTIKIQNRIFGDTDSYLPALQASVSGEDPPEIYAPHVLAIEYGKAGIALDLKDALGADFLEGFFPSTNDEYTDEGKQYALGWMAQTFGIFYNPEILEQAGVEVPETWDDLVTAAATIRETTGVIPLSLSNNPGPSGLDFLLPLITQVTDDPKLVLDLDFQRNAASWDSPPVVESLAKVKELVDAEVFAPGINGITGDQASSAFYTGKAAMYYSGSWSPQGFNQSAPKEFVEVYQVAETPAWKSGAKHWTANQAGAGLAISSASQNSEAAVEFLTWVYEPERYAKIMNDSNSMPSTVEAAQQITDPFMKTMTSWLVEGKGCPHILFGKGSSDAASNQLAAVVAGEATPDEGAAGIQEAVEKAQAR